MNKLHRLIPILLIAAVAITACSRGDNLSPYGWKRINAEIDTLTLRLERGWIDGSDDSTLRSDVKKMRLLVDKYPDEQQLKVRADYWEGRMLVREGYEDEGKALYRRALQANDSARNPYETHRLQWALEPPSLPYNIDSYNYILDKVNFFNQAGDMMLAASYSMDMGMFLNDIGQSSKALTWLDRADSLFLKAGMENIVVANGLNRSNITAMAGDTIEAVRQLHALVANPEFRKDAQALDLALSNLFLTGHDTTALFQAYDAVRYNPMMEDVAGLYEGYLAGVYLNREQLDSARYYTDKAMAKFDLLWTQRMRVDALAIFAETAKRTGDTARANELMSQLVVEMENMITETRRDDILSHELSSQLADLENENNRRALHSRIKFIIVIAIAIFAISGIIFFYYRRLGRQKLRLVEQQLENEKTTRRLLATQVALQRKQSLIGDIQRSIAATDDETVHRVDSAIRTYKATSESEEEAFIDTFGELHPRFVPRLLEAYPALTPADCRLLTLIAVGMSNKQIANTLGIRPESVKQSRWRLRSKMQLAPGATIESAIAPFLS